MVLLPIPALCLHWKKKKKKKKKFCWNAAKVTAFSVAYGCI
jgi:hypothetical protein